jgi:hypothetical protein
LGGDQSGGGKHPQLGTEMDVCACVDIHSSNPAVPGELKPVVDAGVFLFQKSPKCHLPRCIVMYLVETRGAS